MSHLTVTELRELCKQKGITGYGKLRKRELIKKCYEGSGSVPSAKKSRTPKQKLNKIDKLVVNTLCKILNNPNLSLEDLYFSIPSKDHKKFRNLIPYDPKSDPSDMIWNEFSQISKDVNYLDDELKNSQKEFVNKVNAHFRRDAKYVKKFNVKKSRPKQKLYKRYLNDDKFECNLSQIKKSFESSVSFLGLDKGNGVNVHKDGLIITNAHVFLNSNNTEVTYRPFYMGSGHKGVAKLRKIYPESDFAVAEVVSVCGKSKTLPHVNISKREMSDLVESPVLLVGFILDSNANIEEAFGTSIGWVEKYNLSKDEEKDLNKIVDDRGRLIHSCFTMWGTSGSGIYDCNGDVIGIHQGWDNRGRKNITMTFYENNKLTLTPQYIRNGVPNYVMNNLK